MTAFVRMLMVCIMNMLMIMLLSIMLVSMLMFVACMTAHLSFTSLLHFHL